MNGAGEIRFGGLGLVSRTAKTLDRSTTYDHLFPKPDWKQTIVRRNGTVRDVVAEMRKVIFKFRKQTDAFAPYMRGRTIYETCRNLWNFWYYRCAYKEDQKGLEQLRAAGRSYWEGAGFEPDADPDDFGIDCDDFAIAVSQCLLSLGIPHYLRIARYFGVEYFQHVYVWVPYGNKKIFIDCVLDEFDAEKFPEEIQDFLIMDNKDGLNGIDIAVLSGIGDTSPLIDIVTGADFHSLNGLGETSDDNDTAALYAHLKKTRDLVAENPELVKEAEHPEQFLQMLDYALHYWNTDKRTAALEILAARESELNQLRGTGPGADTEESEIELHGLAGGGYIALGKVKGERKFFNKVKETVKKVGEGVKTAAQAVVRYNPITIAARAGVLLALKTNLFHLADHLKWGYLAEAEARTQGFDMDEWKKSFDAKESTRKMFVHTLQGDEKHLQDAVLTGRAGGLASVNLGSLGIEPVTTATTTAAATGFIAQIKAWVKNIDLKKMLKKVNVAKLTNKLQAGKDAAPPADPGALPPAPPDDPGTDDGKNKRETNEGESSMMLPLLGLGLLGALMLSSGGKKKQQQFSGFGSTGSRRKSKKKKNKSAGRLSGVTTKTNCMPGIKTKRKKKGAGKGKVKKMTLR